MIFPAHPRSILIAPDKFKGSLSAIGVTAAVARGLSRIFPAARLYEHPIADGGEGSVEMALRHGFRPVTTEVRGPLSGPIPARFAVLDDTAVIEMAAAAGLALLGPEGPSPASAMRSTTYGVGQLIAAALDHGVTRVVVGVGGSATTDGGAGALVALGAAVRDASGAQVPQGAEGLLQASRLDLSGLDPRVLHHAHIVVACDVEARLTGPQGAAVMFSPQKGADPATVSELERALGNWADCVAKAIDADFSLEPGSGAAGGLAFGLASVLGARIAPGIDVLLDISRFDQAVSECDLVIVGEGSLDTQSLLGKGPIGVARRAADLGVPSIAVVGRSLISHHEARRAGLDAVINLADFVDEKRSMTQTAEVIEQVVAEHISAVLADGGAHPHIRNERPSMFESKPEA
jgi:glycerate kinase